MIGFIRYVNWLVVWLNGSMLVSINKVKLCRAQLLLGGMTIIGWINHPGM